MVYADVSYSAVNQDGTGIGECIVHSTSHAGELRKTLHPALAYAWTERLQSVPRCDPSTSASRSKPFPCAAPHGSHEPSSHLQVCLFTAVIDRANTKSATFSVSYTPHDWEKEPTASDFTAALTDYFSLDSIILNAEARGIAMDSSWRNKNEHRAAMTLLVAITKALHAVPGELFRKIEDRSSCLPLVRSRAFVRKRPGVDPRHLSESDVGSLASSRRASCAPCVSSFSSR